jgi:hypothetical protein
MKRELTTKNTGNAIGERGDYFFLDEMDLSGKEEKLIYYGMDSLPSINSG